MRASYPVDIRWMESSYMYLTDSVMASSKRISKRISKRLPESSAPCTMHGPCTRSRPSRRSLLKTVPSASALRLWVGLLRRVCGARLQWPKAVKPRGVGVETYRLAARRCARCRSRSGAYRRSHQAARPPSEENSVIAFQWARTLLTCLTLPQFGRCGPEKPLGHGN